MLNNSRALKLFIIIELFLGIDFLFPQFIIGNTRKEMEDFMPLLVWAIFFIIFSILGCFSKKIWQYICFVSLPLILYASIILSASIFYGLNGLTGITTYTIIGLASIIIASGVFKK